ncbi:MAG TPA: hypothetical protein VE688_09875 [Gaiellaceae bacterium]|nr:hypothetical protein [Gaiellaceae bacterium]
MAKKKFDPKAKAKRQKVIAAVGGVLLLAILAIQVPRTMKLVSSQQSASSDSSASSPATTTPGTQPLAPPSLDGSAAGSSGASPPATSTTAEGVSDPTSPLPPSAGQLISFSRFKSKDPFKQQIETACGSDATSPAGSSCATSSNGTAKTKTAAPGVAPSVGRAKPTQFVPGKPTKATISVNGVNSTVSVSKSFPAGTPVFTLVSLTRTAAKIGIAGGSYESGAATVTLTKGKAITLMNTADGARYILRLVSTA